MLASPPGGETEAQRGSVAPPVTQRTGGKEQALDPGARVSEPVGLARTGPGSRAVTSARWAPAWTQPSQAPLPPAQRSPPRVGRSQRDATRMSWGSSQGAQRSARDSRGVPESPRGEGIQGHKPPLSAADPARGRAHIAPHGARLSGLQAPAAGPRTAVASVFSASASARLPPSPPPAHPVPPGGDQDARPRASLGAVAGVTQAAPRGA